MSYIGSKRSSSLVSATEITLDGAKLKSSGDSITKSDGTTVVLSESSGTVTFTTNTAVIEGSSSGDLVRITQTGSGNALVVEDSANPDGSPFVVNSSGYVGIGATTLTGSGTPDETDGGEGIRLLPFGFFGIGRSAGITAQFNRSNDGDILGFRRGGATVGSIGTFNTGGTGLTVGASGVGVYFRQSADSIVPWSMTTNYYKHNSIDLGDSGDYFKDAYIYNGVTTGSDANEKTEITTSELGLDFINKINPVSYKFIGRYRTHYGMISQEIETLLSDVGKTSMDFAGFIKSPVTDDDGNETGEYRYGLRYTEFISPMIKAIQEQQTLIESQQSQIDTLTAKTQEQDLTIASLISRIEALETQP